MHAWLLAPSLVPLLETSAVDPGWPVPVAEAIGPASLMRYIDRNPRLSFQSTRTLHDARRLGRLDGFTTVNSIIFFNNVEIAENLYTDTRFMTELYVVTPS